MLAALNRIPLSGLANGFSALSQSMSFGCASPSLRTLNVRVEAASGMTTVLRELAAPRSESASAAIDRRATFAACAMMPTSQGHILDVAVDQRPAALRTDGTRTAGAVPA